MSRRPFKTTGANSHWKHRIVQRPTPRPTNVTTFLGDTLLAALAGLVLGMLYLLGNTLG